MSFRHTRGLRTSTYSLTWVAKRRALNLNLVRWGEGREVFSRKFDCVFLIATKKSSMKTTARKIFFAWILNLPVLSPKVQISNHPNHPNQNPFSCQDPVDPPSLSLFFILFNFFFFILILFDQTRAFQPGSILPSTSP